MVTRSSKREEALAGESPAIFKSHKSDKKMENHEEDDIEVDVSADEESSS